METANKWFDALGKVVGSASMGKVTKTLGHNLDSFNTVITDQDLENFFQDPKGVTALQLLGNASTGIIYTNKSFLTRSFETSPSLQCNPSHKDSCFRSHEQHCYQG
jgi:hypothetical protein